jgi:hypothetical protein
MENDDYTIDLSNMNNTTSTITITNSDCHIGDISVSSMDSYVYTIDDGTIDLSNISTINWPLDNSIDPHEIERMCKEYPALEKVWRNFKSVYDMVKQDYEGKKKAGEIDDDIPF